MAEFGTYSLADVAAQVLAKDAKFFRRDGAPLAREDEITRYWKVDNHLRERVRAFLDLYGDGDHYLAGTPPVATECHSITDPLVDGVSQPGLWRVARVFEDPQLPGCILQNLRRGWITALVSGTAGQETVDWSEARLAQTEAGSLLPAPAGAGATQTCRRKVVTIRWPGIAPAKRKAVADSLMALASTHAAWAGATIRGEALGGGWVRLGAVGTLADDGSGVVDLVLAQSETAFEFYTGVGTAAETRHAVLDGVPADLVQSYLDTWRKYGSLSQAGSIPRGGSAQASVDAQSGLGRLQFSWKPSTAAAGAVVYGFSRNPQTWEIHFIAWNQPATNLAAYLTAAPTAFTDSATPSAVSDRQKLGGSPGWRAGLNLIIWPDVAEWTLAGFEYDEETELYRWHVVWRPIPDAFYDNKTAYTSRWEFRSAWDLSDPDRPMPIRQVCGTQFGHEFRVFSTLDAAWAFRAQSALPDSPYPRLIGDKWLAVRNYVNSCTGWITMDAEASTEYHLDAWHGDNDYDFWRFATLNLAGPS